MWLLLLVCAAAIAINFRFWILDFGLGTRRKPKIQNPKSKIQNADVAFWGLLVGVDAYHHTLIAEMFAQSGGIPANYEPYAPLASFTYHYGFHALVAAVAWLSGQTAPADMLALMPQAGQVATALPVLTLTLFTWRTLGDRWAGLAAGALAGLVSIFPSFYVNWSRYTQGLGLALLPVAWVLLIEALDFRLNREILNLKSKIRNPKSPPVRPSDARGYRRGGAVPDPLPGGDNLRRIRGLVSAVAGAVRPESA